MENCLDHPPIPPNCSAFAPKCKCCPGQWFVIITPCIHIEIQIDKAIGMERMVIASVARCSWHDEYRRLLNINGGSDEECKARGVSVYRALINEKLWKEWSKKNNGDQIAIDSAKLSSVH